MSEEHFIEYLYLRDTKTKELVVEKFSKEMAGDDSLPAKIGYLGS